jgi:hypothetical protein
VFGRVSTTLSNSRNSMKEIRTLRLSVLHLSKIIMMVSVVCVGRYFSCFCLSSADADRNIVGVAVVVSNDHDFFKLYGQCGIDLLVKPMKISDRVVSIKYKKVFFSFFFSASTIF